MSHPNKLVINRAKITFEHSIEGGLLGSIITVLRGREFSVLVTIEVDEVGHPYLVVEYWHDKGVKA